MILGLILQQAIMLGGVGYGIAYLVGQKLFPDFPRRVVLTNKTSATGCDRPGDLRAVELSGHLEGDAGETQRGLDGMRRR